MRRRHDDPLPVRLYRHALVILPLEFRQHNAAGMVAMLADEWRDRRGLARAALLARALLDLMRTAVMERVSGSGGRHQKEPHKRPSKAGGVSWLDVKLALRMLVKHPGLTLGGGLGLAVGIFISVGFYSAMMAYFFPTLPLDEGERVVALENWDTEWNDQERRILHDFFTWREELESVEDLAAFQTVEFYLTAGDGPPELVQVAEMTAAGFRLARVPPLLGRYLLPDDEREGAPPVLVIGYDVWRNRFAGDPDILGREVRLGRVVHTVVGVMPEGFAFPQSHDYWVPLRERPSAFERRAGPVIFIAGRLAPGITMEMAQAELSAFGERTAAAFPETHERLRPVVMPYTHTFTGVRGVELWQFVLGNLMASLVLVVVALNVAVLVYARTAARHGEMAVRAALGASRGRVIAQLFVEALVLSLGAALLGLAIAQYGAGLGNRIMETEWSSGRPFWLDFGLRPRAVLVAVAVAVLVAVITGVLPALQATGRRLELDLRQLGSTRMRLGRTWTVLIVAQVAIAVAALPAAVNLGWSGIRGALTRPTYPAEEFAVASLFPEAATAAGRPIWRGPVFRGRGLPAGSVGSSWPPGASIPARRLSELLRRLEADPAVVGATIHFAGPEFPIRVDGVPTPLEQPAGHTVATAGVHTNFAEVFGLRLLSGRSFEPRDTVGNVVEGARVVIVTQAFVRDVLGGGDAVGRRIRPVTDLERAGETVPVRWWEIVGVVEDATTNPVAPELVRPTVYIPIGLEQLTTGTTPLTVRLRGSTPADFAWRFRQITADVNPSLRLATVRSLADSDRQARLSARLIALVIGLVLITGLLLSAAGIYAMMSFIVTRRRKEIGIRAALGAQPAQVLRSVFSRAAAQIALGLAVGVAAAAVIERLTGGEMLDGRSAVLLPALALVMVVIGLLAALGPARRSLGIQPTEALREE